jgi:hypothetical protein
MLRHLIDDIFFEALSIPERKFVATLDFLRVTKLIKTTFTNFFITPNRPSVLPCTWHQLYTMPSFSEKDFILDFWNIIGTTVVFIL